MSDTSSESIRARLKELIVTNLHIEGVEPATIGDDDPLFESLGLDSVDALEIMVVVEKDYGVRIEGQDVDPNDFASIGNLAGFVERLLDSSATPTPAQ